MIIENWLSVGAGVFLIGMVLYGHYRGFLKQCVSLGALVLTIVIVKIATPYMTGFIKDNPLGVDQFAEYVSMYLADMLINAIASILLFIAVFVLIHMVVRWLDLIARLPILYGLNHIAGALLGFAQGLVLLWVAGFVLSLFSATPVGKMLEEQVYASTWLTFLYRYNLINLILGGIVRGIF